MSRRPSISVFFPCYNDAQTIGILVEHAMLMLPKLVNIYEVIVINDASTDDSASVLARLTKKYKRLRVITHAENRGYGGALRSGFSQARYDLVFYTDGDGQYDVRELPLLYTLMTRDADFINGIKAIRRDATHRIIIGNLYSMAARWFFWLPVLDIDCDFRLIRKKILKKITLTSTSGTICVELVKKAQRAGARFRQVTVTHLPREHGASQFFRADRILHTFNELVSLWFTLMVFPKHYGYR